VPIPGSSIDVPCELFSGLNTELAPSDLPEGVSPDNQDVVFLPGSVQTRPGMHKLFNPALATAPAWWKTFVQPNEDPLTLIYDNLNLLVEDVNNSPGTVSTVWSRMPNNAVMKSATAFGSEWIASSDGKHGVYVPLRYDGTFLDRVTIDGPGASPTVADSATAGSISAGVHKVVVLFVTRSGFVSKPSVPVPFTAAGSKKVVVSNIVTGPTNVVARIIAFTGAGGDNYFYIPATVAGVTSTVISDNSTTSVTLDFSDNALFAATAIDIPGNNLFAQVTLGPCAGFTSYASRLVAWGEYNRIQNFVNMTFTGSGLSSTAPGGWASGSSGGLINAAHGPWSGAITLQITGDGTSNPLGMITQSAYQDYLGIAILSPATKYSFGCWVQDPNGANTGSIIAELYSPGGGGVLATATIPIFHVQNGVFLTADFDNLTPSVIPSDLLLRVYGKNLLNAEVAYICELSVYPTEVPFLDNLARVSYVDAPEQFDGETGLMGSADDQSPIRSFKDIRDTLYMVTADRLHATQDNQTTEPSGWTFRQIADKCGSYSLRSDSGGEDWWIWAGPNGVRIFEGQFPWKVSQEVQTLWDNVNLQYQHLIWAKNDPETRRCYFGVPSGAGAQVNQAIVLDYRELDTAQDIGKGATIHISFTGKMIASDLARKWTKCAFGSVYGDILSRPNNVQKMMFGSLLNFQNLYYLDPLKYSDDDIGTIPSYYTTYFFVNHEAEVQLGVGSHRKLYTYLSAFVSGVGKLTITPYAASLTNPWTALPAYTLTLTPGHDLEWPINVTTERVAFKFSVAPLAGQTDAAFNLQKVVVKIREDPWMPVRGAI